MFDTALWAHLIQYNLLWQAIAFQSLGQSLSYRVLPIFSTCRACVLHWAVVPLWCNGLIVLLYPNSKPPSPSLPLAIRVHGGPECCWWASADGKIQVGASNEPLMQGSQDGCRPDLVVVVQPCHWPPTACHATCNGSHQLGLHLLAAGTWLLDPALLLKLSAVETSAWGTN